METARVRENRLPSGVSGYDYTIKIILSQYRPSTQGSWEYPKSHVLWAEGKFSDRE